MYGRSMAVNWDNMQPTHPKKTTIYDIPYQVTIKLLQQDNICVQKWQTGHGWRQSFSIHKDDKVYGPTFVGAANCACNFGHQSKSASNYVSSG